MMNQMLYLDGGQWKKNMNNLKYFVPSVLLCLILIPIVVPVLLKQLILTLIKS